jgi:predicted amidohydrolase
MKFAIAQLNYTVGDIDGNAAKIADAAVRAAQGGASLLLTTELAICGYSPEDLLLRDDFYDAWGIRTVKMTSVTTLRPYCAAERSLRPI